MSITPASRIATSALRASGTAIANSAHDVANINTPDFKAGRTTLSDQNPGVQAKARTGQARDDGPKLPAEVSLSDETVDQIGAAVMYRANLSIIRAEDERLGTLLDVSA